MPNRLQKAHENEKIEKGIAQSYDRSFLPALGKNQGKFKN